MTANESETEKSKVGWFELLRELARRLKDELFLLAFLFALLVAQVAIFTRQFSIWVAVSFVALYLIAVSCYLVLKFKKTQSQMQEETKEFMEWAISRPSAFQNPYTIAKETPNLRIVHFDISVKVRNHTKDNQETSVYLKSPTQAVVFVLDSPKKVWRRRFGILPYREEVEFSLDSLETRSISSNQEEAFTFHAWYRPHFAFRDFDFMRRIVMTYDIFSKNEERFLGLYVNSGDKKFEIPFKDVVKYEQQT